MTIPADRLDGADLETLARRARALLRDDRRAVLGIVGAPGAGKSTLVDALLAALRTEPPAGLPPTSVAHVPMDGFHLADVQLERLGLLDRKGAPDTFDAAGYAAALRRARDETGTVVYVPGFERDLEQPIAAAIAVPTEARLVITEGNYLLLPQDSWSAVRALLDEVWYVDPPASDRVGRLVARHVSSGKSPAAAQEWVERVDEPNARLVETTREAADVIVTVG